MEYVSRPPLSPRDRVIFLCINVLILLCFITGILLSVMWFGPNVDECQEEPEQALKPIERYWNNRRDVGTVISYKCNNALNSPLYKLLQCNSSLRWQKMYQKECRCYQPPTNPIRQEVMEWNQVTDQLDWEVTYRCDGFEYSAMAMKTVCTNMRRWQESAETKGKEVCQCDKNEPEREAINSNTKLVIEDTNIGGLARFWCQEENNTEEEMPIYKIMVCNPNSEWKTIQHDECACPYQLPESLNEVRDTIPETSFPIGFTYHFRCTANANSYIYNTVICNSTKEWEEKGVEEELPCESVYSRMTELDTYYHHSEICESKGGSLIHPIALDELKLMFRLAKYDRCKETFVGVKEDHTRQWQMNSGEYFTPPEELWAEGYPKGDGKCLAMNKSMALKNVPCTKIATCTICEGQWELMNSTECSPLIETRCFIQTEAADYNDAIHLCRSNLGHVLIHVTEKNLQEYVTSLPDECTEFFLGVDLKERVYISSLHEILTFPLFTKGEPVMLEKRCLKMSDKDKYQTFLQADCSEKLCSLCEFQGPDHDGLVNVLKNT